MYLVVYLCSGQILIQLLVWPFELMVFVVVEGGVWRIVVLRLDNGEKIDFPLIDDRVHLKTLNTQLAARGLLLKKVEDKILIPISAKNEYSQTTFEGKEVLRVTTAPTPGK